MLGNTNNGPEDSSPSKDPKRWVQPTREAIGLTEATKGPPTASSTQGIYTYAHNSCLSKAVKGYAKGCNVLKTASKDYLLRHSTVKRSVNPRCVMAFTVRCTWLQ